MVAVLWAHFYSAWLSPSFVLLLWGFRYHAWGPQRSRQQLGQDTTTAIWEKGARAKRPSKIGPRFFLLFFPFGRGAVSGVERLCVWLSRTIGFNKKFEKRSVVHIKILYIFPAISLLKLGTKQHTKIRRGQRQNYLVLAPSPEGFRGLCCFTKGIELLFLNRIELKFVLSWNKRILS